MHAEVDGPMGTKTARSILTAAALAGVMAGYPSARGGNEKTFRGEIADSQCALNVHSLSQSHKEMIEMKHDVKTNADCARYCVKERGGRFVLQTPGQGLQAGCAGSGGTVVRA